jgi:hypothetical protein
MDSWSCIFLSKLFVQKFDSYKVFNWILFEILPFGNAVIRKNQLIIDAEFAYGISTATLSTEFCENPI